MLRRELNGLVAAWHHRTGQAHGVTHAALRKECGGPAAAVASAEHAAQADRPAPGVGGAKDVLAVRSAAGCARTGHRRDLAGILQTVAGLALRTACTREPQPRCAISTDGPSGPATYVAPQSAIAVRIG